MADILKKKETQEEELFGTLKKLKEETITHLRDKTQFEHLWKESKSAYELVADHV
jgi:hypothetical protein